MTDIAFLFNGDTEEEWEESGDRERLDILYVVIVDDSRQHFLARPRIGQREADRGCFVKGVCDQMQCSVSSLWGTVGDCS